MGIETKGERYYKEGNVTLIEKSSGVHYLSYHFTVKQDSGNVADVWYKINKDTGSVEWSCGAVGTNKYDRKWSCTLNLKADKTKAWCSHCHAANFKMKNEI